jgi:hypothetical protein
VKRLTLLGVVLALLLGTTLLAQAMTAPEIKITNVAPPVPAVRGADTSLELRDPAEELVLLDTKGQPWLRINQSGVTRRNEQGQWEEIRKESFYYLTETEVGRFVTSEQALPYPWRINGTYGGRPFSMEGTYVPPRSDDPNSGGLLAGLGVLLVLAVLAVAAVGGLIYGVVKLVQRRAH